MKLAIAILAFAAFAFLAHHRKREQRGTYKAVADELGLNVDGHAFSGQLGGYQLRTWQVRHRQGRYHSVGAKVLETRLRTVPPDLVIDRESVGSTIARIAGVHDLEVGHDEFDAVFRISCHDETAARAWLDDTTRRDTMLKLNELVDRIEIEDRRLHVEIPTDPVDEAQVRELLEWFVDVAGRLDEPRPGDIPLNLELRSRRTKWTPVVGVSLALLPLVVMGAVLGGTLWSWGAFEPREPRTEIGVWTDGHGMSVPKKREFINCVQNTPKSPDVDFSECETLALDVNMASSDVRDAYFVMRTIQARKAARVDLDPDAIEETIQNTITETLGSSGYDQFVNGEVIPLYRATGMHQRYRERTKFENEIPSAAINLEILYTGESPIAPDFSVTSRRDWAIHCLDDGRAPFVTSKRLREVRVACSGDLNKRHIRGEQVVIAALESYPDKALAALARTKAGKLAPEAELAWYVGLQTAGLDAETELDPATIAARLEPPSCLTPWTPDEAFGEPDALLQAAESAPPLADRLRLYAARQHAVMGEPLTARKVVGEVLAGREAVCAAQLETALGGADAALARLEEIEETHGGLRPLAEAYAHAVTADWKTAFSKAHEAFAELPHAQRKHAAIVIATAAMHLDQDDGLNEAYGEVPEVSELGGDPVQVARWFGQAGRDELDDRSDRWLAPTLPLLRGSEPLQYLLAAKLAGDGNVELWLNIVTPDEFEPFGVAGARRFAAQQRKDTRSAKFWQELEASHKTRVRDASTARLFRIARRSEL